MEANEENQIDVSGNSENQIMNLEKNLQDQNKEIAFLKLSLKEVQDRLKAVEDSLLQSKPKRQSTGSSVNSSKSNQTTTNKSRASVSGTSSKPKLSLMKNNSKESVKKTGSSDNINRIGKKPKPKSKKQGAASKQPSYNEEDGAVKMYLRGRPITYYKPASIDSFDLAEATQLPEKQLALEWIYGYRGKDCRSNLYYLPSGEIVYFIAAVVILYDEASNTQRHYLGHNDDIKCLALHPSKTKIATGQVAGLEMDGKPRLPQVHIWDVESLETLHVIKSFDRAVIALGFSTADGGAMLCAVDDSNDHVLSVWNWEKEKKITETKSSKDPVLGCDFNPVITGSILTYGKNHICFWTLEKSQLTKKQGLFEKHDKAKFILCVAFTKEGEAISGDSNGNIQIWSKTGSKKITKVVEGLHDGPVFSIYSGDDYFLTGGKDGIVKKLNNDFSVAEQTQIPADAGAVRVVTSNESGVLLIGTRSNRIVSGKFEGDFKTLIHGHLDELWGLAIHPTKPLFLSGAYDKQVVLWDTSTHTPMWIKAFDDSVQSAAFHPVHDHVVAVTMTNGRWLVYDSTNQEVVTTNQDGPEQHDAIRYSPDGLSLAIGSHDNHIYIYDVSEDGQTYSKVGCCSGHSSYITHFDWSKDGLYIQSNSGDYELLYWDAKTCKQITAAHSLRDVEWDSQTCVLGFTTLGIWPEGADGTDINTVARSNDHQLLATGDDFGKVRLFNYPCSQLHGTSRDYKGHSSHVTSVRFLPSNEKLMSTGGRDCSIIQWHVE